MVAMLVAEMVAYLAGPKVAYSVYLDDWNVGCLIGWDNDCRDGRFFG